MKRGKLGASLGLATSFFIAAAAVFSAGGSQKAETAVCGRDVFYCSFVYQEEDTVFRQAQPCKKTAITCNVDWGEEQIPRILDILKERGIHITFFVSGRWAQNNPKLLRRMYVEGHEIGSHGYGHKLCSQISSQQITEEMEKTEQAIEPLLGIKLRLFAPPSGDYDARTVEICRKKGYRLILWSADTIDWKQGSTAEIIARRVLKKELDGGIILMHPKEETVKALPVILDGLKERNLSAGTLFDLGIY